MSAGVRVVMKMVMKKLPAGNDYSFKNVRTTMKQSDGTEKTVMLNGKNVDDASIEEEDDF